ncbi:MAG: dihydrolipoamide acetyltransferase family protein [Candidatus Rokuibacteriota bacterium]
MPKVEMAMETGTIVAWKVAEGQAVTAGDVLFEIETDKATMEVEAPASGTVASISVGAGAAVPVGRVVALIYPPGEEIAAGARRGDGGPPSAEPSRPDIPAAADRERPQPLPAARKVPATPSARHVANIHAVDLGRVSGSGTGGRVHRADVEIFVAAQSAAAEGEIVPYTPARKLVARRTIESVQRSPHFHVNVDLDMTAVLALRGRLADRIARRTGARLSVTAILIRLMAPLLLEHPHLNASALDEGIRLHRSSHVGVAMDRDGDLMVPVLRHADRLDLEGVTRELARLKAAVRERRASAQDLKGSTFTLSNLGMYGVDSFTAIINPPESAILAVGRVADVPVGRVGQVVLRPMATFTLSADHRVVDGVTAARFMRDLREAVESPETRL